MHPINFRKLWYNQPAEKWVEALPVGNGRLGGMVFGGIEQERIQLNEDTLWSGRPKDKQNYQAIEHLAEVRKLLFKGEYRAAQHLLERRMLGGYSEAYQPLGDLYLDFQLDDPPTNYRRELDLNEAVSRVSFTCGEVNYQRTVFSSEPDQVMVIHLTSDQQKQLNFTAKLVSPHRFHLGQAALDQITLDGRCPVHTEPSYAHHIEYQIIYEDHVSQGMQYRIQVKALLDGGSLSATDGEFKISDANSVTLILAAATSYNGPDKNPALAGRNPKALVDVTLDSVADLTYQELLVNHIHDYQALFNRVDLYLGDPIYPDLPTDQWLKQVQIGELDPGLVALYFDYGRYLLIASSRPGTQPANLQGIWNQEIQPPWSSNYTTNINVEMNYWPAEVCNLAECHTPLFDLISELAIAGSETAKTQYGCEGWVANHNTDLWRHSTPVGGSARYAYWPMAGAWLVQHLWEHYAYGGDQEFLRKDAYPVMKRAAKFYLDWLIVDNDGYLVTAPSTSPENDYITESGESAAVSIGATMDMSLIWDLFTNCVEAAEILGIDQEFADKLGQIKAKLLPLKIGKHGQLQEWFHDFDEAEPSHRHVSHLFGLYPGRQILKHRDPKLSEACATTLKRRLEHGGGHTGWSCAWLISLFARLEDTKNAYQYVATLLRKSTYDNLFDAHPPFQIDGNFGGVAGIAEILLQSHAQELSLLPGLPNAWSNGYVKGLRARGGFQVNMAWNDHQLTKATIKSTLGNRCRLRVNQPITVTYHGEPVKLYSDEPGLYQFSTVAGANYEILVEK